jgi:hypothetical protein
MGSALDDILGEWDRRERHERTLPLAPWRIVGRFSALIRLRWLAAVERTAANL